jgi:hypothetical protein
VGRGELSALDVKFRATTALPYDHYSRRSPRRRRSVLSRFGVMHRLAYEPRSEGGQNWSGASAGYRATCTCGRWNFDGVVRDPASARDRSEAEKAHLLHEASADD